MSNKLNMAVKGISLPIALACAISAVMAIVGTVAYLTSISSDVNLFAIGRVQVELTESDTSGKQEKPDGTVMNFYELTPDAVIPKDPAVTVPEGSEACWVFVNLEESANLDEFVAYSVDESEGAWIQLSDSNGNDVAGVWYREVGKEATGKALSVLKDDRVQVLNTVTWSQLAELDAAIKADQSKSPTLSITAYAVQRAGIDSPIEAWGRIVG